MSESPTRRAYVSTTSRPSAAVRWALVGWFGDPANRDKSNREAARVLQVDEGTVRKYRRLLCPDTATPPVARKRRRK